MATKTKTVNHNRVAVLRTHVGENLIIRANPSKADVLRFVEEHNRRYHVGEPGGPSGIPSFLVTAASFYEDERDADIFDRASEEIDISDLQ